MAADDVAKVREIYEHWARGNWVSGREHFADDLRSTTFDADGDEIHLNSREELETWFRGFLQQWDDFRQDVDELVDCGDRVLVIGHQSATGHVSGVRLEMPVFTVWVFRDGKIVEFHSTRHEGVARRKAGLNVR
jgi:ketosteroid isomerase-like protein